LTQEAKPDRHNRVVVLKGITKYFPGTIANDHIDVELHAGEVLALLGENGAGKTTLMNLLYGLYQPDEGQILIEDQPVRIRSPHDAMRHGIGMIHQHFMLIPVHSVVENVLLGVKSERGKPQNPRKAAQRIRELGDRYGLGVDPHAIVGGLPVGIQQRVEILKALYREARVLIMDEPTGVLTPQEIEKLFDFVRDFRERGHSVIFITHKLREVMALANRITVLRDGKVVGSVSREETTEKELAHMMVGRDLSIATREGGAAGGAPVLEIRDLHVQGESGTDAVDGLSLDVRKGEILGIAGVSGNGQEELAEAVCGLRRAQSGTILLSGEDLTNRDALSVIQHGVGYIPADRQREGLVLEMSVAENAILKSHIDRHFVFHGWLNWRAIRSTAADMAEDFSIKTPSVATKVKALSGGNQQKVVVGREISIGQELLIAVQPTRGLDVGAAEYVHSVLLRERQEGKAILLISTELSEVMSLSDRIGVIYRGKLLKTLPSSEATVDEVGLLMTGVVEGSDDKTE
jgi:general nucleoside transport system ATP-binding protein